MLVSVAFINITLLVRTLCVKKSHFVDIRFFSLQSYHPGLAVGLLLCLHWCQWFTINESVQMAVGGLKKEDGNRQHVVSKTKPNIVRQKPEPNQNRPFHGESGVLSLSCYVQSDSVRYQGAMFGYIQLWWAFVAFFFLAKGIIWGYFLLLQAQLTLGSGSRLRILVGQGF